MTVRDAYPIPRTDECIDSLGDAVIFSTLEYNSGYWQIPMADEYRHKTAFVSDCRIFRWLRIPFGLKNAPETFQRATDVIPEGFKWLFTLVYLDDIIIISSSIEELYDHLATVLDLVHKAGIFLKLQN